MGDKNENLDYQIWLDEYNKALASDSADISIGDINLDTITVSGASDVNYDTWLNDYIGNINIDDWSYTSNSLGANDIKLTGAGEEMLRVAKDGFYVRGVRVEADEKEAKAVYEAFKQWMTYAILNGEINN